jgi:transcriptional regulator with GAF, ATPase, and Fis domain
MMNSPNMNSTALEQLLELTWRLAEPMPLDKGLQHVADATLALLPGADHGSVRLVDERGRELTSWARSGLGQDKAPGSFRVGEGLLGWVCKQERALRLADAPKDKRFVRREDVTFEVRSFAGVPIWVTGKVAGVLSVSAAEPGAFAVRDEALLRLLACCATPLLDRARGGRICTVPQLEHALASPLRLRLSAELIETGELGLSLEEAIVQSGRHQQDVEACLKPMVREGIVEFDGARYRLRPDLPPDVMETLQRVVKHGEAQLSRERHVRHRLLGGMIGLDPKMQMVFELVRQVARVDVPVLITGETGTGKELVARAIHDYSPRCHGFFGAVNCATLREELFESQVFGHARGAFTGAVSDYTGFVERCNKGTLFLDEVGELSLTNQVKLLRLLQEGLFTRLGDTQPRRSDFRLISATNRDLEAMVAGGGFREDLYYRLAVFPVRIPSLRERIGDLKYLVEGILAMHAKRYGIGGGETPEITPEAVRVLERYHWPGNVRELENVMARAVVMAGGSHIRSDHLYEVELLSDIPPESGAPPDDASDDGDDLRTLDDVQREHIATVLRHQRGNIKATAQILGISRTTLYKKIRDFAIDAPL